VISVRVIASLKGLLGVTSTKGERVNRFLVLNFVWLDKRDSKKTLALDTVLTRQVGVVQHS
jgi:hypothetical protein